MLYPAEDTVRILPSCSMLLALSQRDRWTFDFFVVDCSLSTEQPCLPMCHLVLSAMGHGRLARRHPCIHFDRSEVFTFFFVPCMLFALLGHEALRSELEAC
ncbi:unnamed protein product [Cladocopium goreaui]|uniref:Uncharacterized protein n=1 Tax=Cladocopium goreaui TaxID=2562237 RepID=A0A9P1FI88_9DINO|nr:unnamed protein product [Cladocopium goreaui]|mmetsp:Transcript_47054/g.102468  ORF Transcript_47054/g.102468 Transcript_47054/m.102468 type:complete len:101 (+) Transcript_47054:56-358(+)